jgi:type II secretory pathway pseudopilin PulG
VKISRHFRKKTNRRTGRAARQSGYMLLVIMFMLTVMIIALAEVAPSIAQQIRRDREEELVHRGTQYARAIRRFYKKTGRYPARIEELENTNNVRFLRKRYKDPITGSDEWRLIHLGEAKLTPTLFGLSSGGATAAGGTSTLGGSSAAGASPASILGTQPSPLGPITQGTQAGTSGTSGDTFTRPVNQTFGGGPIVGVSSTSDKESIKEMQGKTHYNEWEFVYDPRFDPQGQQGQQGARPGVGAPGQGTGTPGTGPGFGGLPGIGTGPPAPPTQPPTQPPH